MRSKICTRCNELKAESEFHRNSKTDDGLQYYCKSCLKAYSQSASGKAALKRGRQKLIDAGYFQTGKGAYRSLRQGAEKRGIELAISYDDWKSWIGTTPDECVYCGSSLARFVELRDFVVGYQGNNHGISKFKRFFRSSKHASISRMTIDHVDNALGYTLHNIVKSCWICNSLKNDFLSAEHMRAIAPDIVNKLASAIDVERSARDST